ncbi:MAG: urease accessory protein UreF [Ancrocorticia sp.]
MLSTRTEVLGVGSGGTGVSSDVLGVSAGGPSVNSGGPTVLSGEQVQWELPAWQLPLAQLCDSAAPTGAFSHSYGLETYVDAGVVSDGDTFLTWLRAMINASLTTSDAYAMKMLYESASDGSVDPAVVRDVDNTLYAQILPRQSREASVTMGGRMVAIARMITPSDMVEQYSQDIEARRCHGHPAVAIALVGIDLGAPISAALGAHLQGVATSLTQNAVRLIPLGQNAGQRALAAAREDIAAAVARVPSLNPYEFGATAPGLEIAQMRHERMRARMYMS